MLGPAFNPPPAASANLLTDFFDGDVEAWGMVVSRFTGVRRKYTITMNGFWSGSEFVLDEVTHFDDGQTDRRSWIFTFDDDGALTAECNDLVRPGTGTSGPDEIRLDYVFKVQIGGRTVSLRLDDCMHVIDENTIGGFTVMRKFGIKVGTLFTVFRRRIAT